MKRFKYAFLFAFVFCFAGLLAGCFSFDSTCKIKVKNPEHATIVCSETEVEKGTYVEIDIEFDPGYELDYVTINGKKLAEGENWGFYKVTKNITISCVVKLDVFDISYYGVSDSNFDATKTTFTVEDPVVQLGTPSMVGADFDHWIINGEIKEEFNPAEFPQNISIKAVWKEHFNMTTVSNIYTGDYLKITSLTDYGKTLKNLEIPDEREDLPVKLVSSFGISEGDGTAVENLKINKIITDLPDDALTLLKCVEIPEENTHFVCENNLVYCVDTDTKILRFVNDSYFENNGEYLFIEKDVTDVAIFAQQKAISQIKRFFVDSQNTHVRVETSTDYQFIKDETGYEQGNVLYAGNDIVRFVSFGETTFTIAKTVNAVDNYAFKDNLSLKEIIFECEEVTSGDTTTYNGAKYINRSAFEGCKFIRSITLPESMKRLEDFAFKDCHSLIEIPGFTASSIYYMGFQVFAHTNVTGLRLPETMTGRGCFYAQRVTSPFEDSKITLVQVYDVGYDDIRERLSGTQYYQWGNRYTIDDFVLLNDEDGNYRLISYIGTEETITLPETFKIEAGLYGTISVNYTIDKYFLYYNQYVKNVYLKAISNTTNAKTIDYRAFYHCDKLESLMIYEGAQVDQSAVYNCENFDTVYAYKSQSTLKNNLAEGWNNNGKEITFIDYGTKYVDKTVWWVDGDGNLQILTGEQ